MTLDALLAHPDVARLARSLAEVPGKAIEPGPHMRLAAIALILRLGELREPELLMIKRAAAERDPWSGHVACPGGRMEPGDRDLEQTAIRETLEETAIDLALVGSVFGTLDDLGPRTPVLPPLVIRPFVFGVPREIVIVQSREVAEAFWVPLSMLRDRAAWGTGTVHVRGEPREERTFTHGGYLVWGLTERVLRELRARIDGNA